MNPLTRLLTAGGTGQGRLAGRINHGCARLSLEASGENTLMKPV